MNSEMDVASISTFILTLVVNSIVMTAFATIDGLHDQFMDFILNTLGDSADILSLQLDLQDIFLQKLKSHLMWIYKKDFCGWILRSCDLHRDDCENLPQCKSLDPDIWWRAFEDFKDKHFSEINLRSANLSWALDNIPAFRAAFDDYMARFAKVHGLQTNSIPYTEHFTLLKNYLQAMMDQYIQTDGRDSHYWQCLGGGDSDYVYNPKLYEACTYCMHEKKVQWKVILDEWICSKQERDAIMADRSADFDEPEIDLKESRRRDFTKNTKNILRDTKRRLRKKGKL